MAEFATVKLCYPTGLPKISRIQKKKGLANATHLDDRKTHL
jgi:hypothetical protein